MNRQSILAAVEEYSLLGFDTVPVQFNTKIPFLDRWQILPSENLWAYVSQNDYFKLMNLAIRCGGLNNTAVFDADNSKNPETSKRLERIFAGWGFFPGDIPTVQSASQVGRHYYFSLEGNLPGSYRKLKRTLGWGEFRYGPGACIVAPPSIVHENEISLIAGDFRQLPKITVEQALPLLLDQSLQTKVNIVRPKIPRRTKAMLKGRSLSEYQSRSEYDMAILTGLVNKDFEFEEIYQLFLAYPTSGKFREMHDANPQIARNWLFRSYEKAVEFATHNQSPATVLATKAITWALERDWPGRTGSVDRTVFMAHMSFSQKAGKYNYAASIRDIAEYAGISRETANNATKRLRESGLIKLVTSAVAGYANVYALEVRNETLTLPHMKATRECQGFFSHDAFRYYGLGKAGAEIYEILLEQSASLKELAKLTGRTLPTIRSKLRKMTNLTDITTGEVFSMVIEKEPGVWCGIDVDLDRVALILGTVGSGTKQQQRHKKERERHHKELVAGLQRPSMGDSNDKGK